MVEKQKGLYKMKEFIINGTAMKCYPLTAAQRLHFYTI